MVLHAETMAAWEDGLDRDEGWSSYRDGGGMRFRKARILGSENPRILGSENPEIREFLDPRIRESKKSWIESFWNWLINWLELFLAWVPRILDRGGNSWVPSLFRGGLQTRKRGIRNSKGAGASSQLA